MKKNTLNFNFDEKKEFLIYRYVYDGVSKRKISKVPKKCNSYREWVQYVRNKYNNVTVASLTDFSHYLLYNEKKANEYSNLYIGVMIPIVILILQLLSPINSYQQWGVGIIVTMIIMYIYVYNVVKPIADSSNKKIMYEEYRKVIDELIIEKNKIDERC